MGIGWGRRMGESFHQGKLHYQHVQLHLHPRPCRHSSTPTPDSDSTPNTATPNLSYPSSTTSTSAPLSPCSIRLHHIRPPRNRWVQFRCHQSRVGEAEGFERIGEQGREDRYNDCDSVNDGGWYGHEQEEHGSTTHIVVVLVVLSTSTTHTILENHPTRRISHFIEMSLVEVQQQHQHRHRYRLTTTTTTPPPRYPYPIILSLLLLLLQVTLMTSVASVMVVPHRRRRQWVCHLGVRMGVGLLRVLLLGYLIRGWGKERRIWGGGGGGRICGIRRDDE
ncbi:MAG: hypothetical protein NXY57DRAFT_433821 [Lentinula lateritia]|nr:MAG: hypothetical protein NXY57DRAFT_433821 [Lentinula lateritia]